MFTQLYYTSPVFILHLIKYKINLQKSLPWCSFNASLCFWKVLLNIGSGYTLIVINVTIFCFFFLIKENSVSLSFQVGKTVPETTPCTCQGILLMHKIRFLLVQIVTLKYKSFSLAIFSQNTKWKEKFSFFSMTTTHLKIRQYGIHKFYIFTYIWEQWLIENTFMKIEVSFALFVAYV